jgi:hypothetical protein
MSSSIFQLITISSFFACTFFLQVQPSYAIGKVNAKKYENYVFNYDYKKFTIVIH